MVSSSDVCRRAETRKNSNEIKTRNVGKESGGSCSSRRYDVLTSSSVYFIKKGRPTSREVESVKNSLPNGASNLMSSGRRINNRDASKKRNPRVFAILPAYPMFFFLSLFRRPSTLLGPPTRCAVETCPSAHVFLPAALQMVLGDRALLTSITSSRWLHMATNRSKKSLLPPRSISACIVPLLLNVLRHRMIRAR